MDHEETPNVQAMDAWEAVMADMEATAEEYETEGWETVQVHPGDVTPVPDALAIDVVVPGEELETVRDLLDSGVTFTACQVFRSVGETMVYVLIVMEDDDSETALLVPEYYSTDDEDTNDLFDRAKREGYVHTHLRKLTGETIALTHEQPELLAP